MHAAQVINHDLAKAGLYNAKLIEIGSPGQVAGLRSVGGSPRPPGAGRCRCQARRCEVMKLFEPVFAVILLTPRP